METEDARKDIILFCSCFEKMKKYKQNGNYIDALKELDMATTLKLSKTYKSQLHLERAGLNILLEKYSEAIEETKVSIAYEPSFEALKVAIDAILQLGGPVSAFYEAFMFYLKYPENENLNSLALKEMVLLMVEHREHLGQKALLPVSLIPPKSHLEKVLVELSKTNDWKAMAFLILGLFPNKSNLCGAAKNCKTEEISVAPLLIEYKGKVEEWVDSLATAIIKGGSSIEHLREICDQPPVHTAAEIAIQSGFFQLYTVVVKLSDLNDKNKQGLTITKYLRKKGRSHHKNITDVKQLAKGTPEEFIVHMNSMVATALFILIFEKAQKYKLNGDYINALREIDEILTFNLSDTHKCLIYMERAKLNLLLKRYPEAKDEARAALHYGNTFEAFKLYIDSDFEWKGPSIALIGWWEYYGNFFKKEPLNYCILKEVVVLMVKHREQIPDSVPLCVSSIPPKSHLEKVLVELSKTNDWKAMAFLILGLFPNKSNLCGAAKNCKTEEISVAPLLIEYKGKVEEWVDSLATAIIKGGSSIEHLQKICDQPPIHTAAEIAVQSGFFQLYTVVAKLSDLNTTNEQGFTVTKYLQKKEYQVNLHYKRILDINQQCKDTPEVHSRDPVVAMDLFHLQYEKAKKYKKDGNYIDALKVLEVTLTFNLPDPYKSQIHFERAKLNMLLKRYPEVEKDARASIFYKPTLEEPSVALIGWWEFYRDFLGNGKSKDCNILALKEMVLLIVNHKGQLGKEALDMVASSILPQSYLEKVLVELSKTNDWEAMAFLILGLFPNKSNLCGAAKNCKTEEISVAPLLIEYKGKVEEWVDSLATAIIKGGSSIEHLQKICDQPPIHTAAEIAVQCGFFQLYTVVIELSDLNNKNKQGFTVMEYLEQKGYHSNPKSKNNYLRIINDIQQDMPPDKLTYIDPSVALYLFNIHLAKAKRYEKSGKYIDALKMLEVTLTFNLTDTYKSQMHFEKAKLYMLLKRYPEAAKEAEASAIYELTLEALKLMVDAFLQYLGPIAAINSWWEFYWIWYGNKNDENSKIFSLKQIVLLMVKHREQSDKGVLLFKTPIPPKSHLEKVLVELSKTNDWEAMAFLILGLFPNKSNLCGAAKNCKTEKISVAPLLIEYKGKVEEWVDSLATAIIKGGSSIEHLREICDQPPIHTAAEIAIQSGFFQLYTAVTNLSNLYTRNRQGITVIKYLQKKGYQSNPHYMKIVDIYQQIPYLPEEKNSPPEKTPAENVHLKLSDSPKNSPSKRTTNSVSPLKDSLQSSSSVKCPSPSPGEAPSPPQAKSPSLSLVESQSPAKSPSPSTKSLSTAKLPSLSTVEFTSPSPANSRLVSKIDDTSRPVEPCELHCQKLYNFSLEKQKAGADTNKIFQGLVELCQKNHKGKLHEHWISKSIDLIAEQLNLSGKLAIPACLLSMKTNLFLRLVLKLASAQKWICMYQAFESYQQKHRGNSLENFAHTLTAADFLNSITFKEKVDHHGKILTCLIKNGATIGKDTQLEKTALEVCIANKEYRAIIILLKNGLDPSLLTLSEGDTPLHAAAEIALRNDVGYFDLFEYLLQLHDSDPVKYSFLNISCIDKGQQTLYHVACRIKYSKHSLKLVEILYKRGLKSDIPDAAGKFPYQYISQKSNDRRIGYLVRGSSGTVLTASTPKSEGDVAPKKRAENETEILKVERKPPTSITKVLLKEKIDSMDDHKCRELHILSFQRKNKKQVEKIRIYRAEVGTENAGDLEESSGSETDQFEDVDLLNSNAFENLEWEVECTSDVWKTLHDRNLSYKKRKQTVFKIQQLARGDWCSTSYKKIKNVPQTLKLFTMKLSRTSCIVWELAIAFSQRCSDIKQDSCDDDAELKSTEGQVYSEVIRVWSVVFDMKDLKHIQDQIVKSHTKGKNCLVQKQLQSIYDRNECFGEGTKRLPRLFAEKQIDKHQLDLQCFCPPSSDRDHEYHIIKFYSFSTALVSSMLRMDSSQSVDFPFLVTELEHHIINFSSTAPIILLGRSGTGKTTCCLYRLWMNFVNYWSKAHLADAPIYPTSCIEKKWIETDGKLHKTEIGEDADQDDSSDGKKDQFSENLMEEFPSDDVSPDSCHCSDVNTDGQVFTHLHQLFVTKNGVLCSEVLKNFQKLCHGCEVVRKSMEAEDLPLPHTFKEITDNYFPLFLTSKKLWIILDASLDPPYFFPRQADGSLKSEVLGWSNEDNHLAFLPSLDDDDDDDDNTEDLFALPYEFLTQQSKVMDQRKEVTYEIFLRLWPEINKPQSGYHPSLVWTEIISFIKGSFEALNTKRGYLSEDLYISIGRKRAPNFNGERDKVYQLFLRYQKLKRQKRMFDESDVVFNLHKRLQKVEQFPCPLHEIYVDETQDFTQAELCLLIQLSENPNQMFLTGDTAQSIMRGVSFRFSDLRTLFFYAQEHSASAKRPKAIHCPKSLYELPHNYRSHQGILKLASSVIDILFRYFSDSFDPMEKDQGLFDGPKPKLLESCSFGNLAMLLRGNKRQASHIEFGAHQVILVVNNESREKLPKELSTGLVLTIFEAKGLEFDDVLLYNFFQDSQASKEWRVVTEFLQELVNKQNMNDNCGNQDKLVKINMELFQASNRPRPLAFNSNLHKILNSELKLLYTALTRARVNLWIFDEDMEKRAPMFDYFKTLDLVQPVNTDAMEEKDINELIFAEHSTPEMWLQRGDELSCRSLYEIAAKCYHLGGHVQQETTALANHQALTAQRCPNLQKKKEHFLRAAELYMDCNQHIKVAKCLANANEKLLSAQLYEKCQEYEIAGLNYLRLQYPLKASQCFEIIQQFDRTVDILHDNKMYDHAIDVIQRYNFLVESYGAKSENVPEILLKHKPQKDINYLCYQSADSYYKEGKFDEMKRVLRQLPSVERMEFLEKKGLIDSAADILFEEGQLEESVQLLRRNGKYEKCIELARSGTDEMLASCLYTFAQHKYVQLKQVDKNSDLPALQKETTVLLEEAKACYQRKGDLNGYGLCLLLLGRMNDDKDSVAEAVTKFLLIGPRPNVAGCLQSVDVLTDLIQFEEISHCPKILKIIEMGYKLLKGLKSTACTVSLPLREYLQESGFHILNNGTVCTYPKLEPLIQLEPSLTRTSSSQVEYPIEEIKQMLHRRLLIVIEKLFLWVRQSYMFHLSQSLQCPVYTAGYKCQKAEECTCPLQKIGVLCGRSTTDCLHRHEPYTEEAFWKAVRLTTQLMVMDSELIRQVGEDDVVLMKGLQSSLDKENLYLMSRLLLLLLTPAAGNGLPFKTHQEVRLVKRCFVSMRECAVFVRNYLFATWKRVKFHSRQLPDFFLESPVLIGSFKLKVFLKLWMNQLCERAHRSSPTRVTKNSVLILSENNYFCIYEHFIDSIFYLHQKWNPFEALISFTKYTTLLLQKDIRDFPRLNTLLFWCEFFVVLALMLILKSQKDLAVSLPKSYVIQSFFVDCLQKDSTFSLQKAIQETKPLDSQKIKTLWDQIEKLIILMFASDMVKIAEKKRHVISGVTERYILLGLVFSSNSSRGVYCDLVPKIIDAISKMNITDIMAPRLEEALQKIRYSKGSLLLILKELLQRRGDNCGQYNWSYNHETQQGLQCLLGISSPTTNAFNFVEFDSRSDQRPNFDDVEYDLENENENESSLSESAENQVKEFNEQIKAVCIISRAYIAYRFRCLCCHLADKISDYIARESGNKVDYFSDIKLSEAGCNICGISFTTESALPSEILGATMMEKEHSSHIGEDTQRMSEMKIHKKKSSHKEKEILLRRCVNKYRQEIVPVVKEAQQLLSNYEQKELNPEIAYDFKKLDKTVTKLDQTIIQMCKVASWGNLPILTRQVDELKDALATADKKILKKQIASAAKEKVESNILEDEGLDDFVDTQDVVQEPKCSRTQTIYKLKNKKY